ncbi:hypothetical protein OJF2_71510 [Aquisphaera giovannonii]|uniref:Uncharacterized protein n=1 Tax=Aquisphaera giovannonii TaxID=406548 RepID=A0A5B9WD04_9BACT|nr:hypothetical protein [Aquisphaera giovannonii]QEH38548.1 hypothetical protein OJF2_71510 [Aquisphaera giovannonii]
MPNLPFMKLQDRVRGVDGRVTTGDLEGGWVNTDPAGAGIARAVVEPGAGGLVVRIFGFGDGGAAHRGEAAVDAVYAAGPEGHAGVAFTARFDLPNEEIDLHANLSKGLLILAAMTRYRDRSSGGDHFRREFFRRADA